MRFRRKQPDSYRYECRTPLVIDFGGFFTDLPEFAQHSSDGGAVVSAAIGLYARGWIERSGGAHRGDWHGIVAGHRNAVRYEVEAPLAAGLGASAAQAVMYVTLVQATIANRAERPELAESAYQLEQMTGLTSGPAQSYASAVGSFTLGRYREPGDVEGFRPGLAVLDAIEPRMVLAFSGKSRSSSPIVSAVREQIRSGERGTLAALEQMRGIAIASKEALMSGRLDELGRMMTETWQLQRSLHASTGSPEVERMLDQAIRLGAAGAKPVGAGGGGCFLCITQEGKGQQVQAGLTAAGATIIPFRFDWYGTMLTKGNEAA